MIRVEHVTKYYGNTPAIRDLDFEIQEGECVGFLGLNGAGKTTTLRLLSCLLLPTSGKVTVRGLDVETDPHEIRKFIGFLPDQPPLYPEMNVADYLTFAGRLRKMENSAIQKRLPEVMDTCGLTDVAQQPIHSLSHGYRQRVGIGQAIVHDPDLLILDEPINGLDPVQIVEMREMIRALRGKHTILLSSHILSEIEQTCDRILMLHQGQLAAQGTEAQLAEKLGTGVTIKLSARGERSALQSVLQSVPGVVDVQFQGGTDSLQHVVVRTAEDVREQMAKSIVSADLGLLSLEREATGLEQIFVQLSKGGSQTGAATPGHTSPGNAAAGGEA